MHADLCVCPVVCLFVVLLYAYVYLQGARVGGSDVRNFFAIAKQFEQTQGKKHSGKNTQTNRNYQKDAKAVGKLNKCGKLPYFKT